jgi:hypothetical protein
LDDRRYPESCPIVENVVHPDSFSGTSFVGEYVFVGGHNTMRNDPRAAPNTLSANARQDVHTRIMPFSTDTNWPQAVSVYLTAVMDFLYLEVGKRDTDIL